MTKLSKIQAKMFARMYVSGLALHHNFTVDGKLDEDSVCSIIREVREIAIKISPCEDIFSSTEEILNYVKRNY